MIWGITKNYSILGFTLKVGGVSLKKWPKLISKNVFSNIVKVT